MREMRKLNKYLALSVEHRSLLRSAVWRLLLAWGGLRLMPLPRLLVSLPKLSADCSAVSTSETRRIARVVEAAATNLPLSLPCLPQALAVCWMLRARGVDARLYYGVRHADRLEFQAHAWVEVDGKPVIGGRAAPDFTTLAIFPRDGY